MSLQKQYNTDYAKMNAAGWIYQTYSVIFSIEPIISYPIRDIEFGITIFAENSLV